MDDREFIEGVWRKVRYLEFLRLEEEKVKKNEKRIFREKIYHMAILAACLLFVAAFLLLAGFSMLFIIIGGSFLLGVNVLYEYIRDVNFERKGYHGN